MEVTRDTEAVMLLTASFGKSGVGAIKPPTPMDNPLTPTEWGEFAAWLKKGAFAPGDLLKCDLADMLRHWEHPKVTVPRIRALLNRGAALGFALEKWERAGLWVVTRSDSDYPSRLKRRLRWKAPAILFGCGNKGLLNASSIAVVGSRKAGDADIEFAKGVGRRAAECGELVVSGGAAGVDQAAMFGALLAEGTAIGVLSNDLLRAATSTKYRWHLMSGNLALISPFNPEARFFVGNAMARNKYIYCLAHAAIVVSSTPDSGGTWTGAIENLRNRWVPLAVKRTETADSGNPWLVEPGGRWLEGLDDPMFGAHIDGADSRQALGQRHEAAAEPSGDARMETAIAGNLSGDSPKELCRATEQAGSDGIGGCPAEQGVAPAEDLYRAVRSLVAGLCAEPKHANEIADALGVTKPTVNVWIKRLVQDRVLKKLPKPVRYVACETDLLQQLSPSPPIR